MFSAYSERAPLQADPSAADKMKYVNFGAFAPPKQDSTSELGSSVRFLTRQYLIAGRISSLAQPLGRRYT